MSLLASLLFHLNLDYSSIEVEDRADVVRRCYWPLLGLCERMPWLTLAIEASGSTLERADELDPAWTARLRALVEEGRVELVGSGDTQLIGPLVPAAVNRWNQRLGLETYRRLVGRAPRTALVGEMAWSQGIVDAYLDAGYEAVVMEWNNPRRSHPEWEDEWRYRPAWTASPAGRRIALLWVDTIAFQKLQRHVHGELDARAYLEWLDGHAGQRPRHVFLYASDAEVFDHRPGRFRSEPPLPTPLPPLPNGRRGVAEASEWDRMADLLRLLHERGLAFTTPERLLCDPAFAPEVELRLSTAADPVPVKKQPKYNVTRWALSGRDDVGLNARCFARARRLERDGGGPEDWRALCRLWGSDLRTHLTERRWSALASSLPALAREPEEEPVPRPLAVAEVRRTAERLRIETDDVLLELDLRRGLALRSLRFKSVAAAALVGTLPHGHFDDIDWAADFYSGSTVLETPGHARVTDLERVEPEVDRRAERIVVRAEVPTALGGLTKRVTVHADRVELAYDLSRWGVRPLGILRTGMLTLLPDGLGPRLAVTCASGGAPERLPVEGPCDHGRSVSPLVSAAAAFGASDGRIALDDGRIALEVAWPMHEAAALPLLTCRDVGEKRFARLSFSLSELDETHRPGAPLHDFRLSLTARRIAA